MFVNFNILNQLGSPAINSNTFANRPAAGQTGRLFVSTDTFEIYRDNGTSWDLIGGPGSSTVTGSGAAGQVTYWTGASTIGGNNNLFWDTANSRLGIGTTTPGHKLQINGTGTLLSLNGGSDTYMLFAGNGADQYQIGYTDNAADYRRFSIYDSTGAKEVLTIDKQSRYVGINYQYSSLADQPAYTLDVSGSTRATDSSFFVTSGTGQVGINTTSPTQATALIEAVKTDGYGLFLNYATSTGSGSTATALWAINNTAGSGYGAVIEEKTANTTGGQYPLLIKHSLSTGTAAAGMGTGLHFQLPDSTGTFKTTQLTVETTDAAAATYTTRYRFMAQVNGTSTALAYLTSVGLGIGNVIPSYKLDVNGTVRAFGAGNTGNFLAVDTNPGGATIQLNPQFGTGLPILQSVGSFPLLFGTNNTENARITTAGSFLLNTTTDISGVGKFVTYFDSSNSWAYIVNNTYTATTNNGYLLRYYNNGTEIASIYAENNSSALFSYVGKNGIAFLTGSVPVGTERARFTSGGNFLIGTSTDAGQKLQVSGTTYITSNTSIGTSSVVSGYIFSVLGTGGSGARTATFGGPDSATSTGSTGPVVTIYNSNSTTNNIAKLAFAGSSAIEGCSINGQITDQANYYGQFIFTTRDSSGYGDRMVITSAGLVGIGTSAPNANLVVQNTSGTAIPSLGSQGGHFQLQNGTYGLLAGVATSGNGWMQVQRTDGTATAYNLLLQPSGGNVLIGTTTNAGQKLQVNGDVYSTGNMVLGNASSVTSSAGYLLVQGNTNLILDAASGTVNIRTNSTDKLVISNAGDATFSGSIKTGAPSGGTAAAWKLGSYKAAAVVVSTTNYIEVDIGGTLYKLAVVT